MSGARQTEDAPILVTGGTGFLGRWVLRKLVAAGRAEEVRALVRRRTPSLEKLGIEQVVGDVERPETLRPALAGVRHVYHLAGLVSRDPKDAGRMMRVHVDGTRALFEAAWAAKVERVVLASSSGTTAVSKDPDFVGTEEDRHAIEVVSGWPYYLSKIYQERLALDWHRRGLPIVILQPSLLLGPGDTRGSSTEDVRRFLSRKIPIVPEGGINFVDVRDVADAFLAAMDRGRPGERYLLGGPNWTFETFFGRLGRLARMSPPRLKVPERVARWGASLLEQIAEWRGVAPAVDRVSVEMAQHYWYVDSSKAKAELGFDPRDPQETLIDTIRYVRRHFLANVDEGTLFRATPAAD